MKKKNTLKSIFGWIVVAVVAAKAGYDKYSEQETEKYFDELENRVQLLEKKAGVNDEEN